MEVDHHVILSHIDDVITGQYKNLNKKKYIFNIYFWN